MPPNREGSTGVPEFSGPAGFSQHVGSQFEPDPYEDVLPGRDDPGHRARLPAEQDRLVWSLDAALMDTVARLQLDMEEMRAGNWTAQGHQRQVTFYTSTKVPKFGSSWEQYRQVFDAIVLSNGWDDVICQDLKQTRF